MERNIKRQQLVSAIQKFVKEEGLGANDVLRRVSDKGCDVSESTIRRILKADPEKENFSFEVLQRVSNSLLNVNALPLPPEEINSPEAAEREALRAVAGLSDVALQDKQETITELEIRLLEANKTIERLEAAIAEANRHYGSIEVQLAETRQKLAELAELAAFRREQLITKDSQMTKLLEMLDKR